MPTERRPKHTKRIKSKPFKFTSKVLLHYFFLVAFVALLVGGALRILAIWGTRLWRDDARFSVIMLDPKLSEESGVSILTYQEKSGFTTLPLPENLELSGSYNVGQFKIGNLYPVGEIQDLGGGRLVMSTLQNTLGFPIDGWIVADESFSSIIFTKSSNLTFFDKLKLASVLSTAREDSKRTVYLDKVGVLQKGVGGSLIPGDSNMPRDLVDIKVAQDKIGVGVVNSTKKGGLGKRMARVIEGMGAPALWVRTEEEIPKRCLVRGSQKTLDSLTAKKINRLFSCMVEEDESLTSSIELILGKEIAPEFP